MRQHLRPALRPALLTIVFAIASIACIEVITRRIGPLLDWNTILAFVACVGFWSASGAFLTSLMTMIETLVNGDLPDA